MDDRTPLLPPPFVRDSPHRTALRLHRNDSDSWSRNASRLASWKPPVPPRLSEKRPQLRRSSSANEEEERKTEARQWTHASLPQWRISGGGPEYRPLAPLSPLHKSHVTVNSLSLPLRETHIHTYGSGEGSHSRNGYLSASMPRTKSTSSTSSDQQKIGASTFYKDPPSPSSSLSRQEKTNTKKERSRGSKPFTFVENSFFGKFYRSGRSQTPPPRPTSSLCSPVTYRRDNPVKSSQSLGFTRRYGSMPMKKSEQPLQQMTSNVSGRSSSFRHFRTEGSRSSGLQSPLLSSKIHHTETNPFVFSDSMTYVPSGHRQRNVLEASTPPVHRRETPGAHADRGPALTSDKHESWRHHSFQRPVISYLSSDAESQTQNRSLKPLRGDLTTTTTATTTTTNTTSINITSTATPTTSTSSSSSFASRMLPGSLDMNDRSPPPGRRRRYSSILADYSDESGGGGGSLRRYQSIGNPSRSLCRECSLSFHCTCKDGKVLSRSNSVMSDGEGDMMALFGSVINLKEQETLEAKSPTDHFSYLMKKEKEYLACLESMLRDFRDMNSKTPSLIRQHFDLIFKQVEAIYEFQVMLQDKLWQTHGELEQIAFVFTNEEFHCYGCYMVMTPAVQRDLMQYSTHFKEYFPDLKKNIARPPSHINFYVMILDSFRKEATEVMKGKLQTAIDHLNQVKRKANTEMTLKTVIHSPVDLRLGGDMLYFGELYHIGGGSLQKKKYQIILFENLLVITSMKIPYFKYKTHYRVKQLESVITSGDNELHLNVLIEGQTQLATLKFRHKSQKVRDEWINELQKITRRDSRLTQTSESVNLQHISRQQFRMLPLDLVRVFPLISEVVMENKETEERTVSLNEYSLSNLIGYEQSYVNNLSSLLNPESIRPPETLGNLLEKLLRLHSKQLLPALQRCQNVSEFVDYLVENLDELSVYADYLVIRSQFTIKLDDTPQAGPYICPIQHVYGLYFGLMKELCSSLKCKKSAQRVMSKLKEDIHIAQLRVLKAAIVNGRVDFQRSGSLLLYSPLDLKTRRKDIRAGEYIVILFENVIILTKPRQPYYEYVIDIWLDQVNLGPPASHDCTFRVEVRQGGKKEPITYELCANTVEMKQTWHTRLHQQMLVQVEKIRKRVASGGESPGAVYR